MFSKKVRAVAPAPSARQAVESVLKHKAQADDDRVADLLRAADKADLALSTLRDTAPDWKDADRAAADTEAMFTRASWALARLIYPSSRVTAAQAVTHRSSWQRNLDVCQGMADYLHAASENSSRVEVPHTMRRKTRQLGM